MAPRFSPLTAYPLRYEQSSGTDHKFQRFSCRARLPDVAGHDLRVDDAGARVGSLASVRRASLVALGLDRLEQHESFLDLVQPERVAREVGPEHANAEQPGSGTSTDPGRGNGAAQDREAE